MELRTDPNLSIAGEIATLEDVYDLHNADPVGVSGDGVTVAVMDTGVDATHAVFDDVEVVQHDFTGRGEGDTIGHGTAVAGLIAQLAPDVDIVSLRVFGDAGTATLQPIAAAYEWLTENADAVDVCNFSWGATENLPEINRLHDAVVTAGVQDVVAAGNTGARGGSPATAREAFSVGAVTESGEVTRFSSYDSNRDNPDVAALGRNVRLARAAGTSLGQVLDDDWVTGSGTSFAAGVTAGLLARFRSEDGSAPARAFESTARDVPGTPADGEGILDYGRAVERQSGPPTASAMTWDFLGTDVVHVSADWLETDVYTARRLDDRTIELVPDDRS